MNKLISLLVAGCLCTCQPVLAPAQTNCPPERNLDTVAQLIAGNSEISAKVLEGLPFEAFRELTLEMFPGAHELFDDNDGILILMFRGMKTVNLAGLDGYCITHVEQGVNKDVVDDLLRETDRRVAEKRT